MRWHLEFCINDSVRLELQLNEWQNKLISLNIQFTNALRHSANAKGDNDDVDLFDHWRISTQLMSDTVVACIVSSESSVRSVVDSPARRKMSIIRETQRKFIFQIISARGNEIIFIYLLDGKRDKKIKSKNKNGNL